jgi:hypothetical protein
MKYIQRLLTECHETFQSFDLREMVLSEALVVWLASRRNFIHPNTYRDYTYCARNLAESKMGGLVLTKLKPDHLRQYQSMRLAAGCGPHGINHEGSVFQQLMRRSGLWKDFAFDYQPLRLPRSEVGRALTDEEQDRLLRISASQPRWESLHCFLLLSLNTTGGPKEILTLRRKDIDLEKKILFINADGAKNKFRMRPIPLNDVSKDVCEYALKVAERKGSVLPEHYVFPFRTRGNSNTGCFDPTKYQTTFKTSWEQVRIAAGMPDLRLYDARHSAITRLYEDPDNSAETIEQIAGHHGSQMKIRYAHVRMNAKRAALARLVPQATFAQPKLADGNGKTRKGVPLTNQDVLTMLQMGLTGKVICAKIERSNANFDTSTSALKAVKDAGASTEVILAMVEAE